MRPRAPTLCDLADAFADGELGPLDRHDFLPHLARCCRCQRRIADVLAMGDLLRRSDCGRDAHDLARELLEVAIGLCGLAGEAAGWAARRALWAVTPSPVREWINWQGGSARWSVK